MANILTASEPSLSELLEIVEHLEAVAFVPPKQRHTDVAQLAGSIASAAYEDGLPGPVLHRLIKLVTSSTHLGQGVTATLINNLYPQGRISSEAVIQIVCCLGPAASKPSAATQVLLLRWLILVYSFFEDKGLLSKLYAVLFNCLDMISLRKPLCHLLSLVTTRKHVKPFRIRALMELLRNSGSEEKDLILLLKIYKNHCPDIILGDLPMSRRGWLPFKHPDPEWVEHLKYIHDVNVEKKRHGDSSPHFQAVRRSAAKRSKAEVVPDVQTSRVTQGRTSLEELRDASHLVEKIERIDLPNQVVSVLGHSLAQTYISLVQPEAANRRLSDWLNGFLADKLEDGGEDSGDIAYIMALAVEYARYAKEIHPAIISFLKGYLPLWNGKDFREEILRLLEYLPLQSYEFLRSHFLDLLEAVVPSNVILSFYSSLIRQWGLKLRMLPGIEGCKILNQVIEHAELLASSVLERPPLIHDDCDGIEEPVMQEVLEFYSSLAGLSAYTAGNGTVRLVVPFATTVYTLAFTPMCSVISILASVLASYRSALETPLSSESVQLNSELLYPDATTAQLNSYIMDICNLLWRNRALNTEDPNAMACLLPTSSIDALTEYIQDPSETPLPMGHYPAFQYTLSSIFSQSHHVALCNMSAACFAEMESNMDERQPKLKGPVTPNALNELEESGGAKISWQGYKAHMLEWLDAIGSRGIRILVHGTMAGFREEG